MSQKNEKLPTAAYEFEKFDINEGEYGWMTNKMHPNKGTIEFRNLKELVRRKDVEQLIRDSIGDYDERINDAKNIPRAWNMALEKLLEEIQK